MSAEPVKWEEPRLPLKPKTTREQVATPSGETAVEVTAFPPEIAAAIVGAPTIRAADRDPSPGEAIGGREQLRWSLLRQYREDCDLTVEAVAEASALTAAEVEEVEAGEAVPADFSDRELRRLAAAVGPPMSAVFPFLRWPRHDSTPRARTFTGDSSEALGRRPDKPDPEPQPASVPPSQRGSAGAAGEARTIARQREDDRQAELERQVRDLRTDLEISEASDKLREIEAAHAAAKRPLIDRLRRRGR